MLQLAGPHLLFIKPFAQFLVLSEQGLHRYLLPLAERQRRSPQNNLTQTNQGGLTLKIIK